MGKKKKLQQEAKKAIMIGDVNLTEMIEKDPLKWDELSSLYTDGMKMINGALLMIKTTVETNADILEVNKLILEQIQGLNKEIVRIGKDFDYLRSLHTGESGNMLTGLVEIDNIDVQANAVKVLVAYQDLTFKFKDIFEKANMDIFVKLSTIRAEMNKKGKPNE